MQSQALSEARQSAVGTCTEEAEVLEVVYDDGEVGPHVVESLAALSYTSHVDLATKIPVRI